MAKAEAAESAASDADKPSASYYVKARISAPCFAPVCEDGSGSDTHRVESGCFRVSQGVSAWKDLGRS